MKKFVLLILLTLLLFACGPEIDLSGPYHFQLPALLYGTVFEMDSTTAIPDVIMELSIGDRDTTDTSGHYSFIVPYELKDSDIVFSASRDGYEAWELIINMQGKGLNLDIYLTRADSTISRNVLRATR